MFWENTESYETNVFMPWLWKLLPFIDSLVIIHGRYLCRDREMMLVNEWNQLLKAIHCWWNHILITLLAKICIRCLFRQFSQNMSVDILVIDITEVSLFPLMAPYLIHSRVIYQGILTHPLNPEKYCFQSKAEQIYIKNNILKQCHVLQCKLSCNWASVVAVFDVFIFFIFIESFSFKIYVVPISITLFETWPQLLFPPLAQILTKLDKILTRDPQVIVLQIDVRVLVKIQCC